MLQGSYCRGSCLCVYSTPVSLATTWPVPRSRYLVVSRPSTPTGPRAWMRLVEMPTSAPRPNLHTAPTPRALVCSRHAPPSTRWHADSSACSRTVSRNSNVWRRSGVTVWCAGAWYSAVTAQCAQHRPASRKRGGWSGATPEAVREARAAVLEHARRVHAAQKVLRDCVICRADRLHTAPDTHDPPLHPHHDAHRTLTQHAPGNP